MKNKIEQMFLRKLTYHILNYFKGLRNIIHKLNDVSIQLNDLTRVL